MKERHGSTFTAECHVRYLREIHLGDPVQVSVYLLAADEKRMHTFEELRHATEGWLSATSENMTIHIDMNARKTAPFPPDIRARIEAVVDSARGRPASRGHRPQGRDALEVACVSPRSSSLGAIGLRPSSLECDQRRTCTAGAEGWAAAVSSFEARRRREHLTGTQLRSSRG